MITVASAGELFLRFKIFASTIRFAFAPAIVVSMPPRITIRSFVRCKKMGSSIGPSGGLTISLIGNLIRSFWSASVKLINTIKNAIN